MKKYEEIMKDYKKRFENRTVITINESISVLEDILKDPDDEKLILKLSEEEVCRILHSPINYQGIESVIKSKNFNISIMSWIKNAIWDFETYKNLFDIIKKRDDKIFYMRNGLGEKSCAVLTEHIKDIGLFPLLGEREKIESIYHSQKFREYIDFFGPGEEELKELCEKLFLPIDLDAFDKLTNQVALSSRVKKGLRDFKTYGNLLMKLDFWGQKLILLKPKYGDKTINLIHTHLKDVGLDYFIGKKEIVKKIYKSRRMSINIS